MPIIRPVSDLRNHFSRISEEVHSRQEPVFLTKNGSGDMVVMSLEYFEKQMARLDLYEKLHTAEAEILSGVKGREARTFVAELLEDEL